MPVWEYFKNRGLLPSGGATGACRPPTGRQGLICKKNNCLWTPEGVWGLVARPGGRHGAPSIGRRGEAYN